MNENLVPRLVVEGGADAGAALEIAEGQECWIGQGPECALRLGSVRVAPLHAKLTNDHWGVKLFDASGGAGTFVNGDAVPREGRLLQTGDIVTLGRPGTPGSVALVATIPERSGFFSTEAAESTALDEDGTPIDESETGQQARALASSGKVDRAAVSRGPRKRKLAGQEPDLSSELSEGPQIEGESVSVEAVDETPAERSLRPGPPEAKRKPAESRALLVGALTALVAGGAAFWWVSHQEPPPTLFAVSPSKAEPGQDVSIAGRGFGPSAVVRFDGREAPVVLAEPERVIAKVPDSFAGKGEAQVRVTVELGSDRSSALFLRVFDAPHLAKLSPEVAMPGEEIVITGDNLEAKKHEAAVRGLGAEILEVSDRRVRLRVPELPGPQGQVLAVSVKADDDWSNALKLILGRLPIVIEALPSSGLAGTAVTLKGYGFDPDPTRNRVTFGGRAALVSAATPNELKVIAPGGDVGPSQTQVAVVVEVGGVHSASPLSFALARASGATYLPRFFPEPVPGHLDRALVSSEAGPLLMLSGAAEAPSLTARASRTAEALTGWFAAAAAHPSKLERRDSSVLGAGKLLVTATAADAAACEGSVSPGELAGHWTSLLQDWTSLFAAKERPTLLLERTSRARVLDELWRQARRARPEGGVPTPLIAALGPNGWRALRDLALTPVSENASSGGLAFEGLWQGELEQPGMPARSLQVRLQVSGGRLEGFATARSGKVSGDLPLRDVALRQRSLRFVFDFGESPLAFEGALSGASLKGSVKDDQGQTGKLTLKLLE